MLKDDRKADAETEITQKMIEAGCEAYSQCFPLDDDYEEIVVSIYKAMALARLLDPVP